MATKYALILSLILNMALATVLVFAHGPWGSAGRLTSQPSVRELYDWSRQNGLPDDLSGKLILAQLDRRNPATKPDVYWTSLVQRSAISNLAQLQFDERARHALVEEFGPTAANAAPFKRVFQPFADKYPFLSPAKQVALQQILIKSHDATLSNRSVDTAASNSLNAKAKNEIRTLLSDEEYFEYQLRESDFARRLADGRFEFTEKEFRDVFQLYFEAELDEPAVANQFAVPRNEHRPVDLARSLQSVMGSERYLQYQRSRDPVFVLLSREAGKFDVGAAKVESAYKLIQETDQQIASIEQDRNKSSETRQKLVGSIYESRNQELRRQLGNAMYARVESALGRRATPFSLNQPQVSRSLHASPKVPPARTLPKG